MADIAAAEFAEDVDGCRRPAGRGTLACNAVDVRGNARGERRVEAARQQGPEQPAEHVAAARSSEPGRSGGVEVGHPVGSGDDRGVALEQHRGAQVGGSATRRGQPIR